jgi:hypothetical protein
MNSLTGDGQLQCAAIPRRALPLARFTLFLFVQSEFFRRRSVLFACLFQGASFFCLFVVCFSDFFRLRLLILAFGFIRLITRYRGALKITISDNALRGRYF